MKTNINKLIEIADHMNDAHNSAVLKRLSKASESDSYLLTFMGQFSAGKSKLINNLLGKEILPVHITETTAIVTYIMYGEEDSADILYIDGSIKSVPIGDTIEMWQSGNSSEQLANVSRINITVHSELLKNGLIIADTPGINTTIDKHIEETERVISFADRVVYVLGKPLTDSDSSFIQNISDNGIKMIFVRTHMDDLKESEEIFDDSEMKEREALVKYTDDEVFFVSNEEDSEYYKNLYELRDYISEAIANNVKNALSLSINERILSIAQKLQYKVADKSESLDSMLTKSNEEYKKLHDEKEAALDSLQKILDDKRDKLRDKYTSEKEKARISLGEKVHTETNNIEKRVSQIAPGTPPNGYKAVVSTEIHNACFRIHTDYCDSFDKILRENKEEFLSEFQDSDIITDELSELPDTLEEAEFEADDLCQKMESLLRIKEELTDHLNEYEVKEEHNEKLYAQVSDEAEEIRSALTDIQQQLDAFPPYAARYITIKGDHTGEKTWRTIGKIADWATILIPGEAWAKFFTKGAKGGKAAIDAAKYIKDADMFADGARVVSNIVKNTKTVKKFKISGETVKKIADTVGTVKRTAMDLKGNTEILPVEDDDVFSPSLPPEPKPSILDYIGLDYWFAKIGKHFDTPDVKVIDLEYENNYNRKKREIKTAAERQARLEAEKRAELKEITDKNEKLRIEKDILDKKRKSTEEQIKQLRTEIEKEKKTSIDKFLRDSFNSYAANSLKQYEDHILNDIQPRLDQKMESYINLYDFRISSDIKRKREELEDLDRLYCSEERASIEHEFSVCKQYADFLSELTAG